MKKNIIPIITLLIIITILSGCTSNISTTDKEENEKISLLVYSGAGLRLPMEKIQEVYEEKNNIEIQFTFAGSAHNLGQIELINKGDVYIPGSNYYYESANEKGLSDYKQDVAYHIPVIAVPKENPANIEKLSDLSNPNTKIVLGDKKATAIGKLTQKILKINNLTESIESNIVAKAGTVNELVVYLSMNQADASIIWEDNVLGVEEVKIIQIKKNENIIKTIPACTLKCSENKIKAEAFVNFIASNEGKAIFEECGFEPIESKK